MSDSENAVEPSDQQPPVSPEAVLWRRGDGFQLHLETFLGLDRLFTIMRVGEPDRHAGFRLVRHSRPLFRQHQDGSLRFGRGLEPVVRLLLAEAGIAVQTVEWRQTVGDEVKPWPLPRQPLLGWQGPVDTPLLALVDAHEQGVVRYHRERVEPARLIAQIALAYPDKRLIVAVSRTKEARRLRDELRPHVPETVVVSSRDSIAETPRVVVGTYEALGSSVVSLEWADLLVAANAREMGGVRGQDVLARAFRARAYGFLPSNVALSPLECDLLRCMFGFSELTLPRHAHHVRPVHLLNQRISGGPLLPLELDVLALKRRGLWHHPVRNRQIQRRARTILTQNEGHRTDRPPSPQQTLSRVLVLVENQEHAAALARLLRDWPVIGDAVGGKILLHADLSTALHKAIVTFRGLEQIDLNTIDVLVRADGGTGLPPWPEDALTAPNHSSVSPLLLVDFDDRHHPALRQRSRARREAYAEQGWYAAGVDPVEARIRRFLDSRP